MRKPNRTAVVIQCLGLVVFTMLAAALPAAAKDDEEECRIWISGIVGKTEMALAPEGDDFDWEPAELDTCLDPGDYVRTKPESLLAISYGKTKEIRLNALSKLKIEPRDKKKTDTVLLSGGHLVAKLTKKGETFQVKTPTAIAGVRGTEFDVEVAEEGGETKVHVLEGVVAVFNELGEVLAEAGMMTEILGGELPIEPKEFDLDAYRDQLKNWTEQIKIGEVVEEFKNKLEEKKNEIKNKVPGGFKF